MPAGASTLNTSIIQNNTITGYGGFGIDVQTSGTANASHVTIVNNTVESNGTGVNGAGAEIFTGGGVNLGRADSSTLNVLLELNTISLNFNTGLTITSDGTGVGSMTVNSQNNNLSNNAGNGLQISNAGAAVLTFNSSLDDFNGNGGGSGKNVAVTGGDNIAVTTGGTSITNLNLTDIVSNVANGNGLSATTNDSSTLNLVVDTVANPDVFRSAAAFPTTKRMAYC